MNSMHGIFLGLCTEEYITAPRKKPCFLVVVAVNKLSLISESVTEIRINKLGENLTNMTYARPRTCHI
jgi:hypothetical protein